MSSRHEGVKGKPILVIAIETDADFHDVYQAIHKHMGEQGRRVVGFHDFWGCPMFTITTRRPGTEN